MRLGMEGQSVGTHYPRISLAEVEPRSEDEDRDGEPDQCIAFKAWTSPTYPGFLLYSQSLSSRIRAV
jgi:hypothetical protein